MANGIQFAVVQICFFNDDCHSHEKVTNAADSLELVGGFADRIGRDVIRCASRIGS